MYVNPWLTHMWHDALDSASAQSLKSLSLRALRDTEDLIWDAEYRIWVIHMNPWVTHTWHDSLDSESYIWTHNSHICNMTHSMQTHKVCNPSSHWLASHVMAPCTSRLRSSYELMTHSYVTWLIEFRPTNCTNSRVIQFVRFVCHGTPHLLWVVHMNPRLTHLWHDSSDSTLESRVRALCMSWHFSPTIKSASCHMAPSTILNMILKRALHFIITNPECYRAGKIHRMPCLYRSFPAKEP